VVAVAGGVAAAGAEAAGGAGGAAVSFGAVGKTKLRLLRPWIERLWLCVSKRGLGNRFILNARFGAGLVAVSSRPRLFLLSGLANSPPHSVSYDQAEVRHKRSAVACAQYFPEQDLVLASQLPPSFWHCSWACLSESPAKAGTVKASAGVTPNADMKILMRLSP